MFFLSQFFNLVEFLQPETQAWHLTRIQAASILKLYHSVTLKSHCPLLTGRWVKSMTNWKIVQIILKEFSLHGYSDMSMSDLPRSIETETFTS